MPKPPIQLKRSGTATATPAALEHGELALNYADGKVFWKNASNTISSFTLQSYALATHTHAASDVTSGTFDAARLPLATTLAVGGVIVGTGLGVSSGTVSVTYGTNSTSSCRGDDSRLSDTRTPTDGSVTTAKIANDAVTYAKIQNVSATDRLLGRSSAGAGVVEEITCTAFGRSLIDDADAAAARTTLSVQPTASPTFTGTVSAAAANFTGAVSVTSPLTLTGTVAGNVRYLEFATSGSTRWRTTAHFNAETGSNVGSDYYITRWSDAGAFLGTPLQIRRDNGRVTCESGLEIQNNQLLVTAGSASAPGVAVSGDPNTGIAQIDGADTLSLVTNGAGRVRVNASGNVGIGISPSTLLHLNSLGVLRLQTGSVTMDCTPTAGAIDQFVWNTSVDAVYRWSMAGTERMQIDSNGNIRINGAAAATSAVGCIHIRNGTAPTANITDGVVLFAADVSNSSELRVRDEAGNTTTLSPHSFPLIPDGPSEPMAWAYYSERDGRRINVDMLRVVRLLEQLTGEKLVYED